MKKTDYTEKIRTVDNPRINLEVINHEPKSFYFNSIYDHPFSID